MTLVELVGRQTDAVTGRRVGVGPEYY